MKINDKINDVTDTANRWIDDPKNKSAVGVLTVIAAIVLLIIIVRPAPQPQGQDTSPPLATTQKQEINWDSYDKMRANEIWNIIKTSTIIDGLSYDRTNDFGVTFNFKFKFNEMTVDIPTADFEKFVRTWCISIAKNYNNSQYIYVNAVMNDAIISSAEYSPISGNVTVK